MIREAGAGFLDQASIDHLIDTLQRAKQTLPETRPRSGTLA